MDFPRFYFFFSKFCPTMRFFFFYFRKMTCYNCFDHIWYILLKNEKKCLIFSFWARPDLGTSRLKTICANSNRRLNPNWHSKPNLMTPLLTASKETPSCQNELLEKLHLFLHAACSPHPEALCCASLVITYFTASFDFDLTTEQALI